MKNYKEVKKEWFNAHEHELECIEINGENYCLTKSNGEVYEGFRYSQDGFTAFENVTIKPIYKPIGEPDEDGDYDDFEIVEYEVR